MRGCKRNAPCSAFVVVRLVVTATGVRADIDAVPPDPYNDPWNNQPWCGHRKKTRSAVIDKIPVIGSSLANL